MASLSCQPERDRRFGVGSQPEAASARPSLPVLGTCHSRPGAALTCVSGWKLGGIFPSLGSDVIRLSHGYMTGEPFELFQEMRRVRDRIYTALDRRLWPRDQTDLYMLLGCLNCLMAAAADDLGYPNASEELIRAAWAYAIAIDHKPLMAKLRADLAAVAYWRPERRAASPQVRPGGGAAR